jgi:hypothetical protein
MPDQNVLSGSAGGRPGGGLGGGPAKVEHLAGAAMRTAIDAGVWLGMWAAIAGGCFGGGASPPAASEVVPAPIPIVPPMQRGAWTFFGPGQGLSDDVQDVSADEGGNVYVAGGDALYAKGPADASFLRFDASNAGLTRNCNDLSEFHVEAPSRPFSMCRVLAVAGAAPGKAIIGFDSFPIEQQNGAAWTYAAGGADVVAFDRAARTLTRTRHAWLASPPHVICATPTYARGLATCPDGDYWWENGRRIVARIRRVVVNHDRASPMYGDVWLGGQHGTFSAILANAAARGLVDRTAGFGPAWADAKDTWEHEHPSLDGPDGAFLNGEGWALSIDPITGLPWGSNELRTTYLGGYGADLSDDRFWMGPKLDLWPDPPATFDGPSADGVRSMSHCPDGTLWIGSLTHGLARIDPGGQVHTAGVPDPGRGVSAVACDPTDSSVWIGLAGGGVMRLGAGGFERLDPAGLPAFTGNPVQSIQIDRWSATRAVYFAFAPITDGGGRIVAGGGVAAYAGP